MKDTYNTMDSVANKRGRRIASVVVSVATAALFLALHSLAITDTDIAPHGRVVREKRDQKDGENREEEI